MKVKEFIESVVEKYQVEIRLLDVTFKVSKNEEYYLACKFRYPYTDSDIFYGSRFETDFKEKRYSQEEFERMILHEMLHQLTDPLYTKATSRWCSQQEIEDERERLTDRIATIIFNLAPMAKKTMKKKGSKKC